MMLDHDSCNNQSKGFDSEEVQDCHNQETSCNPYELNVVSKLYLNQLYIQVGGFDGISPIDTVECYNQSTNTWSSMGRMISARRGAGVTNLNDKIYAVGGYDG